MADFTDDTIPSINDVEIMGYNCGHYGNRVDILCDVVDRILNGNQKINFSVFHKLQFTFFLYKSALCE